MKAMKAIVEIPPAKAQVKLISFNIFGEDGEPDYTVGLVMTGDLFAVHDQIRAVDKHETEVNGVCIPVVENAKRARFITEKFMKTLLNAAPEGCKDIAKYLSAHTEVRTCSSYSSLLKLMQFIIVYSTTVLLVHFRTQDR